MGCLCRLVPGPEGLLAQATACENSGQILEYSKQCLIFWEAFDKHSEKHRHNLSVAGATYEAGGIVNTYLS